jgi:hypothetical protein
VKTFGDLGRWALMGFFGAIILAIVFVKAGQKGGQSGGEQTATIIRGFGDAGNKLAAGLEGA